MNIKFLIIFLLILFGKVALSSDSFSVNFDLNYSNQKEKNEVYNILETYLNVDEVAVYKRYVNLNFDGKFTYNDSKYEEKYNTDIYSLYFDISNFEKNYELKLGRYSNINNRFMVIDGVDFKYTSKQYFGVDLFGGIPKYITKDDRYINQEFRDTGDRIYGFKIFTNQIKDFNSFLGYSKELNEHVTVQELLSVGGNFRYNFNDDFKFDINALMDYEMNFDQLYRVDAKADFGIYKLEGYLSASKFDVKDGYREDRRVVITNFSSGKEERYTYHLEYPINNNFKIYHGLTHTYLQYSSGEWGEGEIIDVGMNLSLIERYGISIDFGAYRYDSALADANGINIKTDWYMTNRLKSILKFEYVNFDKWDYSKNVYSFNYDLSYKFSKNMSIVTFVEKNSKIVYLPERKIGVKFQWSY